MCLYSISDVRLVFLIEIYIQMALLALKVSMWSLYFPGVSVIERQEAR